jgi:hypothetical protein
VSSTRTDDTTQEATTTEEQIAVLEAVVEGLKQLK